MRIRWLSQSAFLLRGEHTVFVDPFGEMSAASARGMPPVIRARAGRHESPVGEVVGVASEHDAVAGTQRGANTIFHFALDGLRVCHLGDFGQPELRPEHEPPDDMLEALGARVERLDGSEAEVEPLLGTRDDPVVALLSPPLGY
jgi:L-ascorbate metabolism protein UlaG (beta-lactamase superfamily)